MRRNAALIYGQTGQVLTLRVPQGQPTVATFAVFRQWALDEAPPEWSGSATISTVNTTISAAAGPSQTDPQLITPAAMTGLANGRILLAQGGVQELVDVIEVDASSIRTRFPIQHDFTAGATLTGCSITAAVDNTWIANLRNLSGLADTSPDYRVKWTVTVNGATIVVYSQFDVVRSDGRHHVEISDVNERAFGLVASLPVEYREEDGRPIIDGAWRAVRAHMIAAKIAPDSWRDDEALDELVVLRTLRHLAEGGWHPKGIDLVDYVKLVVDNYERYFEQHVASLRHPTSVELDAMTNPYAIPMDRVAWEK